MKSAPTITQREFATEDLLGPLNEFQRRNAPAKLYTSGDIEILRSTVRVSIVGTRHPTPEGRRRAARLARALVDHSVTVVSGLAEGIDTEAHQTAIRRGGKTIAVLGTPLDYFYPRENEPLQRLIMAEHLALTEFASGHPVRKTNFPRRNRMMALISDASVIIEAGESSGTLHQGWEALRLNRPLFIAKSVVEQADLQWPKEMLDYGAIVLTNTDELLAELPPSPSNSLADVGF